MNITDSEQASEQIRQLTSSSRPIVLGCGFTILLLLLALLFVGPLRFQQLVEKPLSNKSVWACGKKDKGESEKGSSKTFQILIFPSEKKSASTSRLTKWVKSVINSSFGSAVEVKESELFLPPRQFQMQKKMLMYGKLCRADLVIAAGSFLQPAKKTIEINGMKLDLPKGEPNRPRKIFAVHTGAELEAVFSLQQKVRIGGLPRFQSSFSLFTTTGYSDVLLQSYLKGVVTLLQANQLSSPRLSFFLHSKAYEHFKKAGKNQLHLYIYALKEFDKKNPRKRPAQRVGAGAFWLQKKNLMKKDFLAGFEMDQHEVNREEYALCVFEGSCPSIHGFLKGDLSFPRDRVKLSDAKSYCLFENKRLPSEKQWVKAARGGVLLGAKRNPFPKRRYPWGNQKSDCKKSHTSWCFKAEWRGDWIPIQLPVTKSLKGLSPYGIEHLSGNVSEMIRDGSIKGGSGFSNAHDINWKGRMELQTGLSWVGFRCVKE